MDKKKVFISVRTEEDRQKLLNLGFTEVQNSNGLYTFLNDSHKWNFEDQGVKPITHNSLAI